MADALYVILRHEGIEKPHFDLMFQTLPGSTLATWRADSWPLSAPSTLEKLPDHRSAYLTFEGEISGNRGTVRRVEQGICNVEQSENHWIINLRALPSGDIRVIRLARQSDSSWRMESNT